MEFRASYDRRMVVEMDGLPLNFIGLDDLKADKRASGRLQDLADLEALGEPVQRPGQGAPGT